MASGSEMETTAITGQAPDCLIRPGAGKAREIMALEVELVVVNIKKKKRKKRMLVLQE